MIINLPGPLPIIKISIFPLPDNSIIVTAIHGVAIPYAECYLVNSSGLLVKTIGRSEPLGKDDSAFTIARPKGTVILYVSEADSGQSGATAKLHDYIFYNAVPPFSNSSSIDQYARDEITKIKKGLVIIGSA